MKRRNFVKLAGAGLSGLVGVERLIKMMVGEPAQAQTQTSAACEVEAGVARLPVPVGCRPTPTGGYTLCGAEDRNVTCYGINDQVGGYAFSCGNYQCAVQFTCEDFSCQQAGSGDFNCGVVKDLAESFRCAAKETNAQFHCEGSDLIGTQFNCNDKFTCNYEYGQGQRFYCDDFHCAEGNFDCYVAYRARLSP